MALANCVRPRRLHHPLSRGRWRGFAIASFILTFALASNCALSPAARAQPDQTVALPANNSGFVDVRTYGAKCDGATDDAIAINRATAVWRAASLASRSAYLSFPAGSTCLIDSPIDLTNIDNRGATVDGNMAIILCRSTTLCIDATGLNRSFIKNITLKTPFPQYPRIGIQWARESDKVGCTEDHADNITLTGRYSFSAIYVEACEDMYWTDTHLDNGDVSQSTWIVVEDGINYWKASSAFQQISIVPGSPHGMDELAWTNPVWVQRGPGHLLWIANGHSTKLVGGAYGNQGQTGVAPIVLFDTGKGNNGDVDIHMHFEAKNQQSVFEFAGPNPTPTVYGLTWVDRGSQLLGSMFTRAPGVRHVTIHNLHVEVDQYAQLSPRMFDDIQAWAVNGDVFLPSPRWWNAPSSWSGCVTTQTSPRSCTTAAQR